MANIPIWPGSSSFTTGSTPFGFYDNDPQFQQEADKVALWCSRRLGYPIVDIELQDLNFYASFEEAVTTYGTELYAFRIRDNYLTLEGAPTSSNLNNALITPNLSNVIRISEQYGTEAGVGGNVTWYSGSIALESGKQDYDLEAWAIENGISGSDIEIRQIFWQGPPAVTRFFDPYAGSGMGMVNLINTFGWGGYSPAINFMLMPINYDLSVIQSIKLNDQVRKSNYSFQLVNNQLRIFPIPTIYNDGGYIWFRYLKKSERIANSISQQPGNVTNVSNVPYDNPTYSGINTVGRAWIYDYALALCKEMLGYVRGKYDTIPVPNESVKLNSSDLITAATSEKEKLIEQLRKFFDETSRQALLERKSKESEFAQKDLVIIPNTIYIG